MVRTVQSARRATRSSPSRGGRASGAGAGAGAGAGTVRQPINLGRHRVSAFAPEPASAADAPLVATSAAALQQQRTAPTAKAAASASASASASAAAPRASPRKHVSSAALAATMPAASGKMVQRMTLSKRRRMLALSQPQGKRGREKTSLARRVLSESRGTAKRGRSVSAGRKTASMKKKQQLSKARRRLSKGRGKGKVQKKKSAKRSSSVEPAVDVLALIRDLVLPAAAAEGDADDKVVVPMSVRADAALLGVSLSNKLEEKMPTFTPYGSASNHNKPVHFRFKCAPLPNVSRHAFLWAFRACFSKVHSASKKHFAMRVYMEEQMAQGANKTPAELRKEWAGLSAADQSKYANAETMRKFEEAELRKTVLPLTLNASAATALPPVVHTLLADKRDHNYLGIHGYKSGATSQFTSIRLEHDEVRKQLSIGFTVTVE